MIAVLDDEPEMRKALRRLLVAQGFGVVEYETGEALLAALDAQRLDCLLLDLHMPGISGFEVLQAMKLRQVSVPVVVLTAHDEPGTKERAHSLGACSYLKKPVDKAALLCAIQAATANDPKPEKA
jgi:FixJ family two-component response regulator